MPGRFQVFTSSTADGDSPVRWRLLSHNGRPVAASASTFPTAEIARSDALALQGHVDDGRFVLTVEHRAGWGWQLITDDDVCLATSARRYARRVECQRAIVRFREMSAVAAVGTRVVAFGRL